MEKECCSYWKFRVLRRLQSSDLAVVEIKHCPECGKPLPTKSGNSPCGGTWLFMEKAPKDGTQILAYANGTMAIVAWEQNNRFFSHVEGEIVEDFHPECWRALPSPPPVCEKCGKVIDTGKTHISTGTGYMHERCYHYPECEHKNTEVLNFARMTSFRCKDCHMQKTKDGYWV